jgi:hypothetical protein
VLHHCQCCTYTACVTLLTEKRTKWSLLRHPSWAPVTWPHNSVSSGDENQTESFTQFACFSSVPRECSGLLLLPSAYHLISLTRVLQVRWVSGSITLTQLRLQLQVNVGNLQGFSQSRPYRMVDCRITWHDVGVADSSDQCLSSNLYLIHSGKSFSRNFQSINTDVMILSSTRFEWIYQCHVGPCHHGMARPRVCGWRVAASILNKQSRTTEKGWSSGEGWARG